MSTSRQSKWMTIGAALFALLLATQVFSATEPAAGPASESQTAIATKVEAPAAEGKKEEESVNPLPDPTNADTYWSAAWVVIIFVIMLIILYRTAWKSVLAGLKAREQRIRQDIADAEAARRKAEETLKEYSAQLATAEGKIRDMMTKASADAEKIGTTLRMQAQQDAEEIKERSTREIDAARKAALNDIYAQAAELSTNIASKILRRNLNADDQRNLVQESLQQLQSAGKN